MTKQSVNRKRKIRMIAVVASLSFALAGGLQSANAAEAEATDNLVFVEGGSFTMGSPEAELERESDEILHNVSVNSFYIAPHEVTQAEYSAITGNNPSYHQGENLPVEGLTWYDAIQYCNGLSLQAGLTPCYVLDGDTVTWDRAANGYRLPTEAEWEYACRAGTATPFHFGNDVQDSDTNCYNAYGYNNDASGSWVNGYLQHITAIQSYGANNLGLYDMHGNVCEWVWDWYGAYDESSTDNPTGPDAGHYKVARGGGWNDFPKHIRSAYRSAFPADVPLYSIGLRLVRSVDALDASITSTSATPREETGTKVLIAYFSQTGNTEGLANMIADMTGADIFRIERETPYSATHNAESLYAEALTECRGNAIPNLRTYLEDIGLDISQYDTILLGYCNWWATIPAPVRSFLDHYDLSGKTILPFCSQGGGRFGQTISAVAKLAPDSMIREGLWVTYSSYPEAEIEAWLDRSGILSGAEASANAALPQLQLKVGDQALSATLVDNPSTEALLALLAEGPVTINMHDYGNMEKVGPLPESLPTTDERITTEAGDLILYQGNSFVIYYAPNTWSFTRLGKIDDMAAEGLKTALGSGDVTVMLSLAP